MTASSSGAAPPDAQHKASGKRYIYAWIALLGFTALSFGADQLRLGGMATVVALGIALIKAGIVLTLFMHLGREPFPVRFVAMLNLAWVALLCLGIAADSGLLGVEPDAAP